MVKLSAGLVLGSLVMLAVSVPASEVQLPEGKMPEVDGIVSSEEWSDSLRLPFKGGTGLFVKKSGEFMCLAVRGASGGIGSVGLWAADSIRILHASTGLITAEYENPEGVWITADGFHGPEVQPGVPYPRGEIRQSEEYREANLAQFGWTANVVELGPPQDMEFVIGLGERSGRVLGLSVVFLQIKAAEKYAVAPVDLDDASLDPALVAGTATTELDFKPGQWLLVEW